MTGAEPIAFAGAALDRAGHVRADPAALEAARRDPAARAVLIGPASAATDLAPLADHDDAAAVFLGRDAEGPLFAVRAPRDAQLTGLRDAAAALPAEHVGLLAYASAMLHWNRSARFCGRCGEPTEAREGGHLRVCPNDHHHHPRTDPVVIMLVTDGDRALLGRQPPWPAGRYSALAGFVEPGEALEAAVAREVREEAGVDVRDVRYVASQPWPFPASLMLGFHADYAGGDAAPQDDELEDVRWWTREEVSAAAREDVEWFDERAQGALLLPPTTAIARLLIDRWLAAPSG
ncbi:MAG: NAD(+) diphosphatase [Solirubrobacterales bacterium]|nr:NAD(+) diphosphatase [Solirubrobacterales bacterium]